MTHEFNGIITQLQQQKAAIEKALSALHSLNGSAPDQATVLAPAAPRKGGMSPAGKRRLIAALKKRWAAKKAAAASVPAPAPAAKGKPRFTPEGRKRLAEAMRKRWASKRTAAQAKKASGKKAA